MKDRTLAPWLQAALGGAAILTVGDALIRIHRSAVIGRVLRDPTLAATETLALADRRIEAIEIAGGWWLIVTAILFMVWTGHAYRDLVRSGARHRMPTALAVLAPLIPIAGLALAPGAMDDLARQSRFPRAARVGWWFGLWVLASVIRSFGLTMSDTLADHQRGDRFLAVAAVPQVVAAALLIGLIGVVTERAVLRRRQAAALAASENPADRVAGDGEALGWYRDPNRQAEVRWWDGLGWTEHVASSRLAPAPVVRGSPPPPHGAVAMPITAKLCLYLGFTSILIGTAPVVLGVGLLALRDVRRSPGAPGRARAWFAIVTGALVTLGLVLAIAFG